MLGLRTVTEADRASWGWFGVAQERWAARCTTPIKAEDDVTAVSVHGLEIEVRREERS